MERERGVRNIEEEPCVANRLHVIDAVLNGDLSEGDTGRGGFAGRKHACEMQRGVAVFQIELVHGGGEVGAVGGVGE